ncbi:MAG: response regulator [Myxococcales bacterium]
MPTKILVADDSATMRRVLEMTFAGEDASVVSVDNGDAALNKLGDFGPDVVFVDAALAGVDGYEVTRRIKAQQGKVAVIVMASQHNPYDDGKGRAAGVDDHISKPFDTQSVIDRVGQVLARPRTAPAAAEAPRPPAAPAVARPPAPAPVAAAAAPVANPAASAQRMAQGTRLGLGAPVPLAPTAAPAAQATAKPAAAPQPVPAAPLRANATMPMAPVSSAKPAVAPAPPVAVARPPAPAAPAAAPAVASIGAQATAELAGKLGNLGLSREQVEGVLALSREVIEQVVWEVVPELAEQIIREELKRLTAD